MTAAPADPVRVRDPLAVVAVAVGAAAVLLGGALTLAQPLLLRGGGIAAITAVAAVGLVVQAVLGVAALVTGLVALLRSRSPLAGAGTAVGAVVLVEVVLGLLTPLAYSLLQR